MDSPAWYARHSRQRTLHTPTLHVAVVVGLLLVTPAIAWTQAGQEKSPSDSTAAVLSEADSPTAAQASTNPQLVRPQAPRETPALPPVSAGQDGFAIQSANGDFRLQIGLLVHADGRFALDDTDARVVDTFAFRRLRPYLRGRFEQPFFSYSGASADGIRRRYSPQVFYYFKSFGGFVEWVHTETPIRKELVREEIAHNAWQVAGSFVLTGEAATDAGAGVRPRANFDFGNGGLGAFQIAARYHTLKVDPRALTLGLASPGASREADAWTVGFNWYLTGSFRYTFNFERTVFDGDPDGPRKAENGFVFRTQVNF